MSEPFVGQIMMVGFNFPPRGWSQCNGQLLPISQNTALFSLLGTTFGGDGRSTFGLPDLRGRSATHVGTGPGLPPVSWGQRSGTHTYTLNTNHLPAHTHTIVPGCNSGAADSDTPVGSYPAVDEGATESYHSESNAAMGTFTTSQVGSGQSFDVTEPYLGIHHNIALQGLFPSRS